MALEQESSAAGARAAKSSPAASELSSADQQPAPPSLITLTTDFGASSPYVAIMKGVILSLHPAANIVDITHAVPPQDVRQGAIVLDDATRWFPAGTLHVVVVDPGVGSHRRIVYTELAGQRYLAPDNGVLSRLASAAPPSKIVALTNPAWWLPKVSCTFHGRDIFAPVAAHLSLGLDPDQLGEPLSQLVPLDWPEPTLMPKRVEGEVTSVDSFGNLVTNIKREQLPEAPAGEELRITCGDHETFGLFRTYADQPEMTFVAIIGSHGFLELAIVGESAAAMLGEGVGSPITVAW